MYTLEPNTCSAMTVDVDDDELLLMNHFKGIIGMKITPQNL